MRRETLSLTGPLVLVLAAWNNALVPRLPGRPGVYEAVNGAATGVLLVVARAAGLSVGDLGLSRNRLQAGALWGGAAAAVVTTVMAAGLATPAVRPLLRDERVAHLGVGGAAYRAFLRIPLGTVLWEEVAFRGVLHAALARALPPRAATAAGAVLFGVWHAQPTLVAIRVNRPEWRAARREAAVLIGCAGAATAGVLFDRLRSRSGSLLAPALLHLAANSGGLLASVVAWRDAAPGGSSAGQRSIGRPV